MRGFIVLVVVSALLTGCRDQPYGSSSGTSGSTSSAIVGAQAAAPTPIVLELTKEMESAAEAAAIQSAYLDAKCAEMADISAELDASRPIENGKKGCPRQDGAPETWGAQ